MTARRDGVIAENQPRQLIECLTYSLPITELSLSISIHIKDSDSAMIDRHRHSFI
ncbi:uncharacterized protein METZ01_LOCUS395000 [marine metagenome]|uniref:Uncharacterized protein n=1 Tax=marine metagenome TaxID=408172 RepID=A0A382V6E5_9ZZZZ